VAACDFAEELESGKTITKADFAKLREHLVSAKNQMLGGIPHVVQQFQERMEKVVSDAKGNIEAHLAAKIRALGMEKLADTLDNPITMLESPEVKQ
jgi:hypothetical protein